MQRYNALLQSIILHPPKQTNNCCLEILVTGGGGTIFLDHYQQGGCWWVAQTQWWERWEDCEEWEVEVTLSRARLGLAWWGVWSLVPVSPGLQSAVSCHMSSPAHCQMSVRPVSVNTRSESLSAQVTKLSWDFIKSGVEVSISICKLDWHFVGCL